MESVFKKAACGVLVALMLCVPVYAGNNTIIEVNGRQLVLTESPVYFNSRTYVPIDEVLRQMGYTNHVWDHAKQTLTVANPSGTTIIVIKRWAKTFTVNGKSYSLDGVATSMNNRMMTPLTSVVSRLGYKVFWDEVRGVAVVYNSNYKPTMNVVPVSQPTQPDGLSYSAPQTDLYGSIVASPAAAQTELQKSLVGTNWYTASENALTLYSFINENSLIITSQSSNNVTEQIMSNYVIADGKLSYSPLKLDSTGNMVADANAGVFSYSISMDETGDVMFLGASEGSLIALNKY